VRILIANISRHLLGGVEKYLESLLPALVLRGHSLALLYESAFEPGRRGIDASVDSLPSWCLKELGREQVLRAVAGWKPDVVYSHGLDDNALASALQHNYPTILYAHTYYGTCLSLRKCHSWPRLEPCARRFGAACLFLYYPRRCGGLNPGTMWQLFQIQSQRNVQLCNYQMVLVASQHMYRECERNGVSRDRLQLLPLYPTDLTPQKSAPPVRATEGRLLFAGRLMDVKGVGHLLRAMPLAAARLGRQMHLTIAGDGPDRGTLEKLARSLGLAVGFTGWVDSHRRSDLMRQADLLTVPSLWPEPFGLSGVEAGCFGLPAVAFAVGGISDWLIPGESGELAPADPPTVAGLADAIVRALADPAHYQKLRLGAWEMAKRYTPERHLEQLEQILTMRAPSARLVASVS
jgi:glycosyltransferase involved in cell wall biosynthesis